MPTKKERAQAQAIYLDALREQADVVYKSSLDENGVTSLPIDPQGRVLFEVRLDEEVLKKIYRAQNNIPKYSEEEVVLPANFKTNFEKELGHPITDTVSLSYDIQTVIGQKSALDDKLGPKLATEDRAQILEKYQGLAKARIISLQQETDSHAHLIGRMVETAVKEAGQRAIFTSHTTKELIKTGVNKALETLNDQVLQLQAKALEKAYKEANKKNPFDETVFKKILNQELDGARAKILPMIAKTVRIEIIKSTGILFDEKITQHLSKHLAESTTGTPNDIVHINKGTGSISFIGGNENTSHHQELGDDHTTDRMMYSHYLKEDFDDDRFTKVEPLAHRQQVRVSSLAVKKLHPFTQNLLDAFVAQRKEAKKEGKDFLFDSSSEKELQQINKLAEDEGIILSKHDISQIQNEYLLMCRLMLIDPELSRKEALNQLIILDTAGKIEALQKTYALGEVDPTESSKSNRPAAFVYNLYTSINSTSAVSVEYRFDEKKNKQTQSAEQILAASHQYNRTRGDGPLCLVQNIPVNGWGYPISIKDSNPSVVNEAALMAQLATLHTVYDVLSESEKKRADSIFTSYQNFLAQATNNNQPFFYEYLVEKRKQEAEQQKEDSSVVLDSTLTELSNLKTSIIASPPRPNAPALTDELNPQNSAEEDLETHRAKFVKTAQSTLALAFAQDAFSDLKNGFTYQALSVFAEDSSIGGCKSANERAQAVNGRVSVLDFVSLDKDTRDKLLNNYLSTEEATNLIKLADNLESALTEKNLEAVTENMNALYESLNLEGFQALVSFIDQGGHAKLGTLRNGANTNYCETVHTDVENAAKWQCHKGLTDNVLAEFCGIKKFNWLKETKNTLTSVANYIASGKITQEEGETMAKAVGLLSGLKRAGAFVAIIATGGTALIAYTLCKVTNNWWHSRVKERFDKIQDNNRELIKAQTNEITNPLAQSHSDDSQQPIDLKEREAVMNKFKRVMNELKEKTSVVEPVEGNLQDETRYNI